MTSRSAKVIDAQPTWAPFSGWTVLLENSRESLGVDARTDGGAAFAEILSQSVRNLTSATTAFAALPTDSYHVTLCDGVNDGVRTIRDTPSMQYVDPDRVIGAIGAEVDELLSAARRPIDWRPESIEVRGHAVVVAMATDEDLTELRTLRTRLLERIGEMIGTNVTSRWRPHLTIGYLVDGRDADAARESADASWKQTSPNLQAGARLGTASAGLYRFDDIATFSRM